MAVSYVEEWHKSGNGTLTIDITSPTQGDIGVAMLVVADATAVSTPAGWTAIGSQVAPSSGVKIWTYSRVLQSSDTAVEFTAAAKDMNGCVAALRSYVGAGVTREAYAAGTNDPTNPGVSANTSGIILALVGCGTGTLATAPSGYTDIRTNANGNARIRASYKAIAGGGATGALAWGSFTGTWATWNGYLPDALPAGGLFFGTNF